MRIQVIQLGPQRSDQSGGRQQAYLIRKPSLGSMLCRHGPANGRAIICCHHQLAWGCCWGWAGGHPCAAGCLAGIQGGAERRRCSTCSQCCSIKPLHLRRRIIFAGVGGDLAALRKQVVLHAGRLRPCLEDGLDDLASRERLFTHNVKEAGTIEEKCNRFTGMRLAPHHLQQRILSRAQTQHTPLPSCG